MRVAAQVEQVEAQHSAEEPADVRPEDALPVPLFGHGAAIRGRRLLRGVFGRYLARARLRTRVHLCLV